MKFRTSIALALFFFGCGQEISPTPDRTVHLAGFLGPPGDLVFAGYWKDGVYSKLTRDSTFSNVHSLYVDGTKVFIGGWVFGPPLKAVYWEDGRETIIAGSGGARTMIASKDGKLVSVWYETFAGPVFTKDGVTRQLVDSVLNKEATGLALLGDDVYISGASVDHQNYQHAQLWKNGQLIFRESEISDTMSIFIHGNDVYMAGYLYGPKYPNGTLCYWKNGQRVNVSNGTARIFPTSMFVTDDHVYIAGMLNQQAAYWKDGEPTVLTDTDAPSMANCIYVQGDDVHVGGHDRGYPAYWKNDVKETIEYQDKTGQVKFIVVGSN